MSSRQNHPHLLKHFSLLLGVIVLLPSCAPTQVISEQPPTVAPTTAKPEPQLKTDGKYYKDDGPPAVDEVDWRSVPDAEVAFAPINPRYNRPYEVFGTRYVPFDSYVNYRRQGMASWYGRRYHGRKTSSGEVYDMYAMTAAHTILPIPSYVRVTRVDDGRSIVVRVNDRGPFLQEREIDLSYTAARKLGVVKDGTAEVIVEAIVPQEQLQQQEPVTEPTPAPSSRTSKVAGGNYLQLGAFAAPDNAGSFAQTLVLPTTLSISQVEVQEFDGLHRVLIGPYSDRDQAETDLAQLQAAGLEALIKVFN